MKSRVLLWLRVSVSLVFVYPPQRRNQHFSDQNVRKSRRLTLPTPSLVVLSLSSSIYPPPLHPLRHCILEHPSRRSFSLWHHCPITPSSTNSADTSPLNRIPRVSNLFPAGVATSLDGMHLPCHIGLVQLPLVRPRYSSSNFERGIDDTEPEQTVWLRRHRWSLLVRCQLRNSSYTISTNVGGETYFGGRQLEGIVKRRQARPRILWKPNDREKGDASGVSDISAATTRLPPSRRRFFFQIWSALWGRGQREPRVIHRPFTS